MIILEQIKQHKSHNTNLKAPINDEAVVTETLKKEMESDNEDEGYSDDGFDHAEDEDDNVVDRNPEEQLKFTLNL